MHSLPPRLSWIGPPLMLPCFGFVGCLTGAVLHVGKCAGPVVGIVGEVLAVAWTSWLPPLLPEYTCQYGNCSRYRDLFP